MKKMSLKTLLVFTLSIVITISIILILVSTYYTTKQSLNMQSYKIMKNVSEFAIDKSNNYMEVATKAAILTKNLQKSSVINTSSMELMIKYFYEQLIINNQFTAIYYATTEGDFVMLLKNGNGFMKKYITFDKNGTKIVKKVQTDKLLNEINIEYDVFDKYDPRVRPWFVSAVENKKLIWTSPYVFYTSKRPGITTATPIFNEAKRVSGVVGIDIEINELANFVDSLKISDNGKVFILDKSSKFISMPLVRDLNNNFKLTTIENIKPLNPIRKAYDEIIKTTDLENFQNEKYLTFSHNDSDYQALFLPLKIGELEWIIGMYALEYDFLGFLKNNNKFNILLIIFIGLITLYINLKISDKVFKSIEKLRISTKELKHLNLNQKDITHDNIKEIDDLI